MYCGQFSLRSKNTSSFFVVSWYGGVACVGVGSSSCSLSPRAYRVHRVRATNNGSGFYGSLLMDEGIHGMLLSYDVAVVTLL